MPKKFSAEDWISRLSQALPELAEVQKPFLENYYKQNPRVHIMHERAVSNASAFPPEDLANMYEMARYGFYGEETYYAPLLDVLDPIRGILRSHPTLERVFSQFIGNDSFWVQIDAVGSGQRTLLTDLIAGLLARTHERPKGGFKAAATELQAFLDPTEGQDATDVLGDLGVGYDVVLFHGLSLKNKISIEGGMEIMSFDQAQAFVDEEVLTDVVPGIVRFRDWRMVGAVTRSFPWRPEFSKSDRPSDGMMNPPESGPFEQNALKFLGLLAVSHRVPVVPLMKIEGCISRSACHLLGQAHNHGTMYWGRPVHFYDPFTKPPGLRAEALDEAKVAYKGGKDEYYQRLAPIVARLAEALSRDGRFAVEDRILDVAIALERMYKPDSNGISHQIRTRAAWFLGENAQGGDRESKSVKEFYNMRSDIIHGRKRKTPAEYRKVSDKGFDIAARTLFKLLDQGPLDKDEWEKLVSEGEKAADQ